MKFSTAFATAASLLATASAHGGVDQYIVGSTTYEGYETEFRTRREEIHKIQMVAIQLSLGAKVPSTPVPWL
jgi:hypothetical protein